MTAAGAEQGTPPGRDATPVLALRDVSRSFAGRPAVRPLSLGVPRERTTVLLGESGSGKSTLLRLMAGLIAPDSGEILLEGTPVTLESGPALRRPAEWRKQRLEELGTVVRLAPDVLSRWPGELSGGQRQRVSLMRALFLRPSVVLLDEPLGALDPVTRGELQQELIRVFRELGSTVVLVTHDLEEAALLGDRVALLREGSLIQVGPMQELAAQPADPWVSRFLAGWRGGSHP